MNQGQHAALKDPSWWKDEHSSSWERAKEALHRDWEQTKADLTSGGDELNQGVGDTVRQFVGKEPIPPRGFANSGDSAHHSTYRDWDAAEAAVRYGHGARQYYSDTDWNEDLEARLRKDWGATSDDSSWDKVKDAVRRGWDGVRRAL